MSLCGMCYDLNPLTLCSVHVCVSPNTLIIMFLSTMHSGNLLQDFPETCPCPNVYDYL